MLAPLLLAAVLSAAENYEQTGTPRAVIAGDYSTNTLARVGADGGVVWSKEIKAIHDLQALPGGGTLYQTNFRNVLEADADGEIVWRYDAPAGVEIHSFRRLPGGATLIAESGARRLLEVAKDGVDSQDRPADGREPGRPPGHPPRPQDPPPGTYLRRSREGRMRAGVYAADGDPSCGEYEVGSKVIFREPARKRETR